MENEHEFIENRTVRVAITPYCNLNCVYCEGTAGYRPEKPGAMEDFRRTPLTEGCIEVDTLLGIIEVFYESGFRGITLTGGEPLMHPHWDYIVTEAARLGMKRVELTTNGTLLRDYLLRKKRLPQGLTLVKIGYDTPDAARYKELTGGGEVVKVIGAVKEISHYVKVRANKVVLRSDLDNLEEYLENCQSIGFHEVNLLDLVMHPNRDNSNSETFFREEYVPAVYLQEYLKHEINNYAPSKYGYQASLPNGFRILLKDSNLTLRDPMCSHCSIFCQEGLYTARVATDGTITCCPDFRAELDYIAGSYELKNGNLKKELVGLRSRLVSARPSKTLLKFAESHNIQFPQEVKGYLR